MRWLLMSFILFVAGIAQAEQRYALLIANQNYPSVEQDVNIFGKLETTVPEMQRLANVLRNYNFKVTTGIDANPETMTKLINQFVSTLQVGDTGLFYYAGHGVQVEGRNYLIPIGKNFSDAIEVRNGAYLAQNIIEKLNVSKAQVKLVFLDSCRNHLPVKDKFRGFNERGFTKMDAKGVIISYGAALGEIASDEVTYTSQLIKAIQTHSNEPIEVVLSEAQTLTAQVSGDRQTPWYEKGMVGKFCFGTCGRLENTAELERLRRENELLKQQKASVQPPIVTPVATPQPSNVWIDPNTDNVVTIAPQMERNSEDKDGDSVPDYSDLCPSTPRDAKVDENGCETTSQGCDFISLSNLSGDFIFNYNKADLTSQGKDTLVTLAARIRKGLSNIKMIIVASHTDNIGTDTYNQILSERRANSVAQFLVNNGLPNSMFFIEGHGENQPIADNTTEEGRAKNRRVEIHIGQGSACHQIMKLKLWEEKKLK